MLGESIHHITVLHFEEGSPLMKSMDMWLHEYCGSAQVEVVRARVGNMFSLAPLTYIILKYFPTYISNHTKTKEMLLSPKYTSLNTRVASILRRMDVPNQLGSYCPHMPLYLSNPL